MKKTPPSSFLASLRCAFVGLAVLIRSQRNARIHAGATVVVVALGLGLRFNRGEWVLVALATTLVWAAEAFNTAIELLADRLHPRQHPQIGAVKDVAAAGVLITVIGALVIGIAVLFPYLFP